MQFNNVNINYFIAFVEIYFSNEKMFLKYTIK